MVDLREGFMNFDSVFVGQLVFVIAIVNATLCYTVGKKKTANPIMNGFIGFISGLIPPIGLVYLAVLVLKKPLVTNI